MIRSGPLALLMALFACSSSAERSGRSRSADSIAILRTYDSVLTQVIEAASPTAAADAYVRFHTTDAVLMIPDLRPLAGRDSIHAFVLAFFDGYRFQFPEWHTQELVISEDWAFHRYDGIAVMTSKTDGQHMRQDRKYLDIWHREPNGAWRIARHVFNLNR